MTQLVHRCKGSRDLLPDAMLKLRQLEQTFKSCCVDWGYREIRTPTLEYLHLFTSIGTLTPSMLSRVYSFLDWDGWSGERVVLRPEATIPAVRLYVQNLMSQSLVKLFYSENIFSFEETGKESRERRQCGVELIGSDKPAADAELILLALEILRKLGLDAVELHLSHAGLLRALLQESGLTIAEQNNTLDQVLNGDMQVLEQIIGANPKLKDSIQLLFQSSGKTPGFLRNLRATLVPVVPSVEASLNNFICIAEKLQVAEPDYHFDITSGKGFEYYTGIIVQFCYDGQKLGGGGRYNDLVPLLGGGDIPASGFALYVDELMDLLPTETAAKIDVNKILVTAEGDDEWEMSVRTANSLREVGYIADLDAGYRGLADHGWRLRIKQKGTASTFVLENLAERKKSKASSSEEVFEILRKTNENRST